MVDFVYTDFEIARTVRLSALDSTKRREDVMTINQSLLVSSLICLLHVLCFHHLQNDSSIHQYGMDRATSMQLPRKFKYGGFLHVTACDPIFFLGLAPFHAISLRNSPHFSCGLLQKHPKWLTWLPVPPSGGRHPYLRRIMPRGGFHGHGGTPLSLDDL